MVKIFQDEKELVGPGEMMLLPKENSMCRRDSGGLVSATALECCNPFAIETGNSIRDT